MMARLTIHLRRPRPAIRSRPGFTLIELAMVAALIGLLAALGIPRYNDMKRRAYAAAVASDFNAVRVAAFNYFADNNSYPPDGDPGAAPAAMLPYLPKNFSFEKGEYTLDYDVWPSPFNPDQLVVGVTVTSRDQQLVNMVARSTASGGLGLNVGNGYTYIFAGP